MLQMSFRACERQLDCRLGSRRNGMTTHLEFKLWHMDDHQVQEILRIDLVGDLGDYIRRGLLAFPDEVRFGGC
jgi:hypothetical protein